jgi:hypothetical protein
MSGEIHEAPIVHGNLSCSSLHLSALEILSSNICTGVDTSLADTNNLVENKVVRSQLQTLVPREFNARVSGDFSGISPDSSLYSVSSVNTFDGLGITLGGVDTSSGLGIQVPASGLYLSNFVFDVSSDLTENVIHLAEGQYLEMTDPGNFQANGSFSIDMEWKGTNFDTSVADGMTGSRVALVSTGGSGNYFGVFATKYDSENYALVAECSDGSEVMTLDLGQWAKDNWLYILATWSSAQNTLSIQINKSRFQVTAPFGNISSRPFYFGFDGTTFGGGFAYKYVRFHQYVLNANSFDTLPVVTSVDGDGFRCEVVYTGGGSVVPVIAKHGATISTIASTTNQVAVTMTTGPSAGPRRVVQAMTLTPGDMKGNETMSQTFVSAPGDIVRFESSQPIVTKEMSVLGLKFDDMKIPVLSLDADNVTVERRSTFTDSGVSAIEIDSNGIQTDRSSFVTKTSDPSTETVGEKYIFYTLTSSDGLVTVRRCKKVNVIDTSLPQITLIGAAELNHERGTVFVDQGATAIDGSTDLTGLIQVHNPVLVNVVGTYEITYDVIDSRGNHAQQVIRKVNIIDTKPPIITVTPGNDGGIGQIVERLDNYTDPGATAVDQNGNEDLTASIQVSFVRNSDNSVLSEVDVATVGTYTVVYQCNDAAVNSGVPNVATQKQRTVTVVDTTKPRIFLNGPSSLTIERLSGYSDQGATAFDYSSAGVRDTLNEYTGQIVTTNPVDHTTSGTYTVKYNVTDAHGNAADEVMRTVVVQDTTPPVITIVGDNPFILERLDTYVDPGATALDGDTNLTSSIVTINLVDNTDAGTGSKDYSVHYDVQDIAGNSATRKTRTVRVVDNTKPRLFLTGPSDITVERLDTYVDQGATAFDFSSNGVQDNATELTGQIVVTNPVDMSTVGDYTVRFDVTDASGNNADQITRTVRVRDTTDPIVTMNRSDLNPYYIEVATEVYVEHSATAVDGNGGPSLSVTTSGSVNTNVVGTYNIQYTATDSTGRSGQATRTIIVRDTIAPIILLNGESSVQIEVGSSYTDAGATVSDASGNAVLSSSNNVNVNSPGSYVYTYTATDGTNSATPVSRTVVVVDLTPEVNLTGDPSMTVERGSVWTDPGAIDTTSSSAITSSTSETLSDHVYFGWAPTYASNNNVWEPYYVKIEQNGVDIVDNETIVYILQPSGNANTNDDSGSHFCQYIQSQSEWHGSFTSPSYWETNKKPLFYRKTNVSLDGSQLIARQRCRGSHWPKHGYIVSAADPAGPWIVRGGWFDCENTPDNEFVDSPLSTTHESDADGWRKVTEIPSGQYINDPFSGTTQSTTIPVEVPIVAMSDVGEYGRDIEVKLVVTYGSTDYEMHYKNWFLDFVFGHHHASTIEHENSGDEYNGRNVCCARAGPESSWTSGNWITDEEPQYTNNQGWNWTFTTHTTYGVHSYNRGCGFLLHHNGDQDADHIYTGSSWPFGQKSGDQTFTKLTVYARKVFSVNDIHWNNGANDRTVGSDSPYIYDSGLIDLMYSTSTNHPTGWYWGGYNYLPLPAWIEAKMPLWGTANVDEGDSVSVVLRQKTMVILTRHYGWSAPWNTYAESEWTRTSDPRGSYFINAAHQVDIYTKIFEPGTYNFDNNSAMYLFAPVHGSSGSGTPASVSNPVNSSNQTVTTQTMMDTPGTYTIQYSASSPSGTAATATRTVVVQDTVAPVFNTFNDVTHERGQSYSDVKPTAYDPRDSGNVNITTTQHFYNVNPNVVGDYQVDYQASDGYNTTTSRRKNVYVRDTVAPVITLTGDGTSSSSPYTWTQGDVTTWSDPGYNARDQVDNTNLDSSVTVDSSGIYFNTPGDYQVVYNLNNSVYGPAAVQKIRYVKIEAPPQAAAGPVGSGSPGLLTQKYNGNYQDDRDWFAANEGSKSGSSYVTTGIQLGDEGSHYSYNWTGAFIPHVSGTWTFWTSSDESSNVWIDDLVTGTSTRVVNNAGYHGTQERTGTINVTAGTVYGIQVTFEEAGGGASMRMDYQPPGQSRVNGNNNGGSLLTYGNIFMSSYTMGSGGMVLPVTSGLQAHHSWFSFQNNNTWEDLTENGNHAVRQGSGTVDLVSESNANTTGFGGLGPWPYINGSEESRWDLFGGITLNPQYTLVYIMRYDVNASHRARIIDMKNRNYLLGAEGGSIGRSHQEGWLNYNPSMQNTEWVLGIEMPNRQVRRGTVTTQWADNTGGGPNHDNLVATINNGSHSHDKSDYNIAELIYYSRVFTEAEIVTMKSWLDSYASGQVHPNYTSASGGGEITFSSWNIPMDGPNASDALTEELTSDDGSVTADIQTYVTHNRDTPHVNNRNWTRFWGSDGGRGLPRYRYYDFGDDWPLCGKHNGNNPGASYHPDTGALLQDDTGDLYYHPPSSTSHGGVVRFTVPETGTYLLFDTFCRPFFTSSHQVAMRVFVGPSDSSTSTGVVSREVFYAVDKNNYTNFINAYKPGGAYARDWCNSTGVDLGTLTAGSYVYFVVDNYNGWASDENLMRFRLKKT